MKMRLNMKEEYHDESDFVNVVPVEESWQCVVGAEMMEAWKSGESDNICSFVIVVVINVEVV